MLGNGNIYQRKAILITHIIQRVELPASCKEILNFLTREDFYFIFKIQIFILLSLLIFLLVTIEEHVQLHFYITGERIVLGHLYFVLVQSKIIGFPSEIRL